MMPKISSATMESLIESTHLHGEKCKPYFSICQVLCPKIHIPKKKKKKLSEIFNIVLTTVRLSINNHVDFFRYFCSLHKTHKTDKLLLADEKRIGTSKLSFHNHHHSQIMLLSNKNYAKKTAQPCTQNPKVVTQRDSIDNFIHLHCVVHATKAGRNSHRVRSFLHGLRRGDFQVLTHFMKFETDRALCK